MIKGLLTYFNDTLILDPLDACSVDVFAFGDFGEDSIAVDDFECELLLKSGSLYSITISMNGMFEASFPESRDFLTSKEASFKLEFSLEASDDENSYDPPSEASKVK